MKYIEFEVIENEVKRFFNSYFESGQDIDSSIYLPEVKTLLTKFGLKIKNKNNTVLTIKNYKSELPDNFYKLILAIGCSKKTDYIPPGSDHPFQNFKIEEFTSNYKINNCENSCLNECGEHVHVIQKIDDGKLITYNEYYPILISRQVKEYGCYDDNCFNFKFKNCPDEIIIKNNIVEANFCEGNIYIEYYETLFNGNELMIPDHDVLIKAVKEQIKLSILEYLLFNHPDPNIVGKYQLQQTLTKDAIYHAINLIKNNEVQDLKDIRNYFVNRYNIFEKMINGK